MSSHDLLRRGLADIARALQAGHVSSREVTDDYLAAIATSDLNAYISVDAEGAREAADTADATRRTGSASPLTGVPIAHKDIFCTASQATTCASKMLEGFVPPYNATVVDRLQAAGVVPLGKANMDEFAMGSSNENSAFGAVRNPWGDERAPGGSSGGSAALVAAGLAAAATGTDTGGSIRQPAAFCGVSGIKPTYGRVSRWGMIAFASSLDQGGAIAPSVEDCAWLLSAMSGFDPKDSTSAEAPPLPDFAAKGIPSLRRGVRIGLPKEYLSGIEGTAMAAAFDAARSTLEATGAEFVDISLPNTGAAIPAYYVISSAEASTNLSRYDGVRFGHRTSDPVDLADMYCRSRSEGFGAEVKRRILTGTYALSVGYYDAYYVKAQKVRRLIQRDFLTAFDSVDLIMAPTTPGPAFRLGELSQDPVAMYQQDVFTVPASLAGLPAMSIPCGFDNALPLGLQLIGRHFDETSVLSAGHAFQQATDFHRQLPEATK